MNPVAVIGAGITGLSAAHQLQKAGVPVTVYEASGRVGGVIRTVRRGEYLAECGPNTILETSPRITALVQELGLASRRQDSDARAESRFVVRGRQPVVLPTSGPKFFTSPLFSWRAKIRLFAEPFIGRASGEESVASFVRRRLGREFLDYAIDPLVSGIYAGDPARLSVQHAFPKIHNLENRYGSLIRGQIFGARERKRRGEVSKASARKFSFDEGLQVLPDTLHSRLGSCVRLNSPVRRISRSGAVWSVDFEDGGRLSQAAHSAVLFVAPAYCLPKLHLEAPQPVSLQEFSTIYYPPVASIVLGFRREDVAHSCCGFGMLIPGCEGFGILGTIFSSALFPRRAPAGHITLTTYAGGAKNPAVASLSEDELVALTLKDLGVLLGVRGQPTFRHVVFWPQAIPQYEVGYGRHKSAMDALEASAPGFFLAGHFRDGVSLGDSIVAGLRAGERLAVFLNAGTATSTTGRSTPRPAAITA